MIPFLFVYIGSADIPTSAKQLFFFNSRDPLGTLNNKSVKMGRNRGMQLFLTLCQSLGASANVLLSHLVMSFMSQFSNKDSKNSPPVSPVVAAPPSQQRQPTPSSQPALPNTPPSAVHQNVVNPSPQPRLQRARAQSNPPPRPLSMVQTYQPPLMEVNEQTIEELQPIFGLLNSHGNKLYQEGYFLKLHDQDNRKFIYTR